MKRLLLAVALASTFTANASPAVAASANVAPDDRAFGRLKLTIIGVRSSLRDLSRRLDARPDDAAQVYHDALLVEDALHDWAKKYPSDPWIPTYAYTLAELYRKIDSDDAQARKDATLDWVITAYPTSDYAKMGRV